MRIAELIEALEKIKSKKGDIECFVYDKQGESERIDSLMVAEHFEDDEMRLYIKFFEFQTGG